MQLVGSLNPYLQATYNFSVNLALFNYPNTEAPYFKGGLLSPLVVALNNDLSYVLPKVVDKDGDDSTVEAIFLISAETPDFITFTNDSSGNKFLISPTLESQIGKYDFNI